MPTYMHTTYTKMEFVFLIYTKCFWNIGLYRQSMFKCPWKIILTHFNCKNINNELEHKQERMRNRKLRMEYRTRKSMKIKGKLKNGIR